MTDANPNPPATPSTEESQPKPARRRRRWLKRILWVLVVLLLGLVGLYAGWVYSPLPARAGLVIDDYFAARKLFLERTEAAGGRIESYRIAATGPQGEPLFIDVAWFGDQNPERVLLHISGTHGMEGFIGSTIQSELIRKLPSLPPRSAVAFVHALNPWGMAHYRRFNENNVDLNRNVHLDPSGYSGTPEGYRDIEWFLNPQGPPARLDAFPLKGLYCLARYGFTAMKQGVGGGQYGYPKGIYYGGSHLEESSRFLVDWVRRRLGGAQGVFVVEIHSGLGENAEDTLFWPLGLADIRTRLLGGYLGEEFESDVADEGVGFQTPGDLQHGVPKALPNVKFAWVLQEFGAYGPGSTLRALVNENRHHFYGGGSVDHWTKRELLEAFCPGSADWQRRTIDRGIEFTTKVLPLLDPAVTWKTLGSQPASATSPAAGK